ncbi:hypothetical protein LCGC14_1378880, partial [marine sediment metagenome]
FSPLLVTYSQYAEAANQPQFLSLSGIHESSTLASWIFIESGRWANTAIITKLEYTPITGTNFKAGTLFSLYRVPRFTIDRQVLAAPAATITFNNIPQGYEALQLLVYARSSVAALNEDVEITINADAVAANYDFQELTGTGAVVAAARNVASQVLMVIPAANEGANEFGGGVVTMPQYTRTDGNKHWITLSGTNENQVIIRSSRWESNNAITRIDLDLAGANNFVAGSVFELVGLMPSKELQIIIDGVVEAATVSNNMTVLNNSNDWTFMENDSISYMDYLKISINGTQQLWFEPNTMVAGSILTDRQGGDHNGTINWGVNPSNIEITVGGLTASVSTVSTVVVNETAPELLGTPPSIIYIPDPTDAELTGMPQYDSMVRFADSIGAPVRVAYVLVIFLVAMAMGVAGLVAVSSGWGFAAGYGFVNALALGTPVWPQFLPIAGLFIVVLGFFLWSRVR